MDEEENIQRTKDFLRRGKKKKSNTLRALGRAIGMYRSDRSSQGTEGSGQRASNDDNETHIPNTASEETAGPSGASAARSIPQRQQPSRSRRSQTLLHGTGQEQQRIFLKPFGDGFDPSKAKDWVTFVIKANYDNGTGDAYPTWAIARSQGAVGRWFTEFKKHCEWDPIHEAEVFRIFNKLGVGHLNSLYNTMRGQPTEEKRRNYASWLGDESYKKLVEFWASEQFEAKQRRMQDIRRQAAPDAPIYRQGRHSVSDIALTLCEKDPEHRMPGLYTVYKTVNSKKDGTIPSQQIRSVVENVESRRETHSTTSATDAPFDEDNAFLQTVGKKNRGRLSGLGSMLVMIPGRHSFSYIPTQESPQVLQMREDMKKLTEKMERQKAKNKEKLKKTKDEVTKIRKLQNKMLKALMRKSKFSGAGTTSRGIPTDEFDPDMAAHYGFEPIETPPTSNSDSDSEGSDS